MPPSGTVPSRAAAFFDVDGTLIDRTIVHYYIYLRRRTLHPMLSAVWLPHYLARCALYLAIDKFNRARFNRLFYRDYRGLDAATIKAMADDCYREVLRPKRIESGFEAARRHRERGERIVLVTGSLDFLMAPLACDLGASDVISVRLVERDDRFTGELDGPPLTEGEKARRIRDYAKEHGVDLSASHAYGDSIADAQMLECVGHPCAVNPGKSLRRLAAQRGWAILDWRR